MCGHAGLLGRGDFPFRLIEAVGNGADERQVVVGVSRTRVAGKDSAEFDLGFRDCADLEECGTQGERDSRRCGVRLLAEVSSSARRRSAS